MGIATYDRWFRGASASTAAASLRVERAYRGSPAGIPLLRTTASLHETGSGGAGLGGPGGAAALLVVQGSGGSGLGGLGGVVAGFAIQASGGLDAGGEALVAAVAEVMATGGFDFGGEGPASAALLLDATGGLRLGGEASIVVVPLDQGPGTLREALIARLKGSSGLVAILGSAGRITTGPVPQSSGLPALTLSIPADAPGRNLSGGDGTSTASVRVDAWAARQATCDAAAEAVRGRFHGFRGRVGLVEFLSCYVESMGDLPEPPPAGKGEWTYRVMMQLSCKIRVSIPDQLED